MSVLRVYEPSECDAAGVPLDWERCRACEGTGRLEVEVMRGVGFTDARDCWYCDGHGSLKAAALSRFEPAPGSWDRITGDARPIRCEDCGHPMSEGTWEGSGTHSMGWSVEYAALRTGHDPNAHHGVHYSPCDEGCRHGHDHERISNAREPRPLSGGRMVVGRYVEQSWRPVDVRTLGWPMDLRPERLAVLCLRCWAAR